MNGIIQELKDLLKTKSIGIDSDRTLLVDFKLEKLYQFFNKISAI